MQRKRPKAPQMKPLEFLGSSRDDLARMPADVRHEIGVELMRVQFGGQPTDFKPMSAVGAGVCEIRVRDASAKADIELAKVRYRMIGEKP